MRLAVSESLILPIRTECISFEPRFLPYKFCVLPTRVDGISIRVAAKGFSASAWLRTLSCTICLKEQLVMQRPQKTKVQATSLLSAVGEPSIAMNLRQPFPETSAFQPQQLPPPRVELLVRQSWPPLRPSIFSALSANVRQKQCHSSAPSSLFSTVTPSPSSH